LDGRKGIESRLTRTRRSYFGRVLVGDKLLLKQSSGPVCAEATVAAVKNYENLTPERIRSIREQYGGQIGGSDELWLSKAGCKYGVLVWLADVRPIEPVRIDKKDWRAWVILTEKKDFGLLAGRI